MSLTVQFHCEKMILKLIVFATQNAAALNYFWKPGDSVVTRGAIFAGQSRVP